MFQNIKSIIDKSKSDILKQIEIHKEKKEYSDYYQEHNFSLRHLTWFYKTPYLRKHESFAYYTMAIER